MKRFAAILLLLIYFSSSSGAVLHLHFCDSKLNTINFNHLKGCCCDEDNEPAFQSNDNKQNEILVSDNCCSDKSIVLKVQADQLQSTFNIDYANIDFVLFHPLIQRLFEFNSTNHTLTHVNTISHKPPLGLWQNIPLYKLYNSLVVYAA